MRRIKIMGLCLVAVCAFAAFASSALALPEIGRCKAVGGTGKYTDSNCTTKAKPTGTGNFEFVKGVAKTGFTASSGEAVLEGESGVQVVCTSSSVTGKLDADGTTGAVKGVENVISTYSGCNVPAFGGITCETTGKGAGHIVTNELEGSLGYINKAKKEVGQELFPHVKHGAFTEFSCGGGAVVVVVKEGTKGGHNCIIAPVGTVNVSSNTNTQEYVGVKGSQMPEKFEGKTECNLESTVNGTLERSGQTQTNVITFEEAVEVKA